MSNSPVSNMDCNADSPKNNLDQMADSPMMFEDHNTDSPTYKIVLIFIVCLAEQITNVSVHHGLCGPIGGSAGQPGPGSADSDQSQGVITLAAIIVINRCVTYMLNIFQT